MTRLAYYDTPSGARVELYHGDNGSFWTERAEAAGTMLVVVDTVRAAEHYDLAEREGHVDTLFPYRLRVVAR